MKNRDVLERTIAYSVRIVNLYQAMETFGAGRVIGNQILRSGTSIGANVHEAQGAQSKADFISKISIAHKEAYETLYWLRVIQETNILPSTRLGDLFDETEQLVKILTAILVNSKRSDDE